jgi:hypothetical protein
MKITVEFDTTLSPRARQGIRWILLPLAVFAGTVTVAHAYDTSWVRSGQPVSSSQLLSNLNEIQERLVALEAVRTEWVQLSGTCTILGQSSAWATASSVGTGECELAFAMGRFSAMPGCVSVSNGVNGAFPRYLYGTRMSAGSSGLRVRHMVIDTASGGAPQASPEAVTIVCTGRR